MAKYDVTFILVNQFCYNLLIEWKNLHINLVDKLKILLFDLRAAQIANLQASGLLEPVTESGLTKI